MLFNPTAPDTGANDLQPKPPGVASAGPAAAPPMTGQQPRVGFGAPPPMTGASAPPPAMTDPMGAGSQKFGDLPMTAPASLPTPTGPATFDPGVQSAGAFGAPPMTGAPAPIPSTPPALPGVASTGAGGAPPMTGAPTPTKSLADALNQASATTPQTQQATPSGRLDMVAGDQSAFPQHGSDALPPPAGPNYSNTNLNALGNNWNVATGGTTGRSSTDALIGQNMAPYYQALGTSAGVGYMSADSSPDGQAHVRASAGGAQYLSNPDGTWSTLGQAPITSDQLKAKIAADGLGGVQAQTPSAPIVAKTALPGESAQDQVTRSAQGITSVKQPLNGIGAPEVLAPPNNGQPTPNAPVHIPSPAELPAPPPVAAIPSPLGPQNLPPQGEGPVQVGTGDPRDMARNGAPAGPLTGVTGNPGVASTGAGGAPPITGAPPVNALPSVALATQPSGAPLQPVAGPSTAPSLTPTNPATALTNQTIATPALQDRFKLALDQWQNAQAATNPQYEASLRDANRMAAAGGALGSGRLQTSIGDLANQRQLQMDTQKNTFLNDALGGSIQDAKDATQQANEQQNFQAGQQGTAFNQGVTKAQLGDNLKNSAFGRSLQQLLAGSSGDPSSILMALSQIFGNQSSAAGQALGQNISQTTTNNRTQGSNNTLQDILNAMRGGGGTTAGQTPYDPASDPYNPANLPGGKVL